MDPDDRPYQYAPLRDGQIRVIELHPPDNLTDPICCSISHVELNQAVGIKDSSPDLRVNIDQYTSSGPLRWYSYSALSYTWGIPERSRRIWCFEGSCNQTSRPLSEAKGYIAITPSLETALKRLRLKETQFWRQPRLPSTVPSLFWIDAVCIDQENLTERGQQVELMPRIYTSASRTLIWLGEEDQYTPAAALCIESLNQVNVSSSPSLKEMEVAINMLDMKLSGLDVASSSPSSYMDRDHPLRSFLSRSWFSRVWVVQEVVMSNNLFFLCGPLRWDWEDIYQACVVLEEIYNFTATDFLGDIHTPVLTMDEARTARHVQKSGLPTQGYISLDQLLLKLRSAKATDPRDKVYAVLGIAKAIEDINALQPDYRLNAAEVYVKTAIALSEMRSIGPLKFLSFVQHKGAGKHLDLHVGSSGVDKLPSWTPDWTRPLDPRWLLCNCGYRASGNTKADMRFVLPESNPPHPSHTPKVSPRLEVKGVPLTKITYITSASSNATEIANAMVRLPPRYSLANQDILDPFHKVIGGGTLPEPQMRSLTICDELERMYTLPLIGSESTTSAGQSINADKIDLTRWHDRENSGHIEQGREFFLSNAGLMGLAPPAAALGDIVALFLGASVLFVLREQEDHFSFIGECYVHGWMNGEVVEGLDESNLRTFSLV